MIEKTVRIFSHIWIIYIIIIFFLKHHITENDKNALLRIVHQTCLKPVIIEYAVLLYLSSSYLFSNKAFYIHHNAYNQYLWEKSWKTIQ